MLNLDLAVRQRGWLRKSQRQMADELEISDRTFGRWERGEVTPGFEQIERWAKALDLPWAELINVPAAAAGRSKTA